VCGLTGFWERDGQPADALTPRVTRMCDALEHRGPDDSGVFVDAPAGLALGFRRLAILDLSPNGHQPMVSADGRFVIVFNGEIYNHRDLRQRLTAAGARFRGTSDTEVLLELASARGAERVFAEAWGMFAIALWDTVTRTLYLGRDRLGKKPLYYADLPPRAGLPGGLVFGSELKALREHPLFDDRLDRDALASYFRYAYVPDPASIYRAARKVPPGSYLVCRDARPAQIVRYWSAVDVAGQGLAARAPIDDTQALDDLDRLLRDAVLRRMESDVPLGAFLSGGIDSSMVVALMQAQSPRPVRTFTIGFEVEGYNEAEAARTVAAHLGTEHTELYVTPDKARDVIPRLPRIFDEPFADSSQIPTFLVSQMARRDVTVALSGDGGDEVFGGYTRYQWAEGIWRRLEGKPQPMRRSAARMMEAVPPGWYDAAYGAVRPLVPSRFRQSLPGDKAHKLAAVLDVAGPDDLYRRLLSQWPHPARVVLGGQEADWEPEVEAAREVVPNFTERMMLLDLVGYLPGDILVKVDRASMAVSLETRAPLLDHRLIEWSWRLPLALKRRNRTGKWMLRQLLYRYVPASLVERPKMGFGVPIDSWLRGPLRDWAWSLIEPARLKREGVLQPEPIERLWHDHQSGRRNHQYRLWVALMFQAWREEWSVTI
jgi:asparagine synthase (glutamine-hydrolysing)